MNFFKGIYCYANFSIVFGPSFLGVFGEHVSLEGVYPFWVYSFVCKPGVLTFGTVTNMDKIYHKSII